MNCPNLSPATTHKYSSAKMAATTSYGTWVAARFFFGLNPYPVPSSMIGNGSHWSWVLHLAGTEPTRPKPFRFGRGHRKQRQYLILSSNLPKPDPPLSLPSFAQFHSPTSKKPYQLVGTPAGAPITHFLALSVYSQRQYTLPHLHSRGCQGSVQVTSSALA